MKTLFAMSGNVCAFRDLAGTGAACEQRLADPSWDAVQAVICHIHGWSPGGPRFIDLPDEERNAYDNLILLCPTHANLIDRVEPDRFSAELLREMKALHESRFVSGAWEPPDVELERYATLTILLTEAVGGLSRRDAAILRGRVSAPEEVDETDPPVGTGVADGLAPPAHRREWVGPRAPSAVQHGRLDDDNTGGLEH